MLVTIQFRRGSETLWGNADTVLSSGEPGWDTTNKVLKVGDGITHWDDLPFANREAIEELIATTSLSDGAVANALTDGTLTPQALADELGLDGSPANIELKASYGARLEAATYTYNADGTVATETAGGFTTTYAYNGDGTVHTATRNGVTMTFSYDANGNVTAVA